MSRPHLTRTDGPRRGLLFRFVGNQTPSLATYQVDTRAGEASVIATLRLGIKNGRLVILDLHIRNGQAATTGN